MIIKHACYRKHHTSELTPKTHIKEIVKHCHFWSSVHFGIVYLLVASEMSICTGQLAFDVPKHCFDIVLRIRAVLLHRPSHGTCLFRLETVRREFESATVLGDSAHDIFRHSRLNPCLDFEGDCDSRSYQTSEMGDDLVGDTACIAAHTSRIEVHAATKPLWSGRLFWLGRGRG